MHRSKPVRRHVATSVILAAGLVYAALAPAAEEESSAHGKQADLVVHATGFRSDQGQAIADLFVQGEDILGKPHVRVKGEIKGGTATLTFRNMTYGDYAVRVFHDENGNGTLDHNFLSIPSEPLGFSNGFSLGVFSGLPTFEKLRFSFVSGAKPIEIVVK